MFEIQVYSTALLVASGFLIAIFYQSKIAAKKSWKKSFCEPLEAFLITFLGLTFVSVPLSVAHQNTLSIITSVLICHLGSTPLLCLVSPRKFFRVTAVTILSVSSCAILGCIAMAAFRVPIPNPFALVTVPPAMQTWLVLFSIGAMSAMVTSSIARARACKRIKRPTWNFQRSKTWMVKMTNRLKRKTTANDIAHAASFLPGRTYSAVDPNFWQELADMQRAAAHGDSFKSVATAK